MKLFGKKNPPGSCPKCGRSDGWRAEPIETPQSASLPTFNSASPRGPFGPMPGMRDQNKKLRYRCEHCGFQKTY